MMDLRDVCFCKTFLTPLLTSKTNEMTYTVRFPILLCVADRSVAGPTDGAAASSGSHYVAGDLAIGARGGDGGGFRHRRSSGSGLVIGS